MVDQRTGNRHDFTRKGGVDGWEQMTPAHAPDWMKDPAACWNSVEAFERRADAQTAREINMALPRELTTGQMKDLTRAWVQKNCVDRGMVATVAWHDLDSENPHAHVMLTMREIDGDGWSKKKARQWNDKALLNQWRETWANEANAALEAAGSRERIDHRSLKDQGLDRVPTRHMGPKATAMERRGETPERQRVVMPTPPAMDHAQALAERQREQARRRPQAEETAREAWQARARELNELAERGSKALVVATAEANQRALEQKAAEAQAKAAWALVEQHKALARLAGEQAKKLGREAADWHNKHRIRSRLGWVPASVKERQRGAEAHRASEQRRLARAELAEGQAKKDQEAARKAAEAQKQAQQRLAEVAAAVEQVRRQRQAHLELSPEAQERRRQERQLQERRSQREAAEAQRWAPMIQPTAGSEQRPQRRRGYDLGM